MRNLARTAGIFSAIAGIISGTAFLVVGCGGDDTVIGYPGEDSGPDVFAGDTGSDVTSPDTGIVDSGADVVFHIDAGTPDLRTFYHQIDVVGCSWAKSCCGAGFDFNVDSCVLQLDNDPSVSGFLFTRPLKDDIDGGQATLDPARAADCLAKLQTLPCGDITSDQYISVRNSCYGAVVGQIAAGNHGCKRSFECVQPAHCEADADGGGTCVAPRAADAPCTAYDQCGSFLSGQPRYCALDSTGGPAQTAAGTNTCLTPQPNGSPCFGPEECSSWNCNYPSDGGFDTQCLGDSPIINPDLCAGYGTPDAGDGG